MSLDQASDWTQIGGFVVALIALFLVGRIVIRKFQQRQSVGGGGTGVQAGRDAKVNISNDKTKPRSRR